MSKFTLFLVALMITTSAFSKVSVNDVVTLNNQMRFKGEVLKIKDCSIKFKTEDGRVEIPAEDISTIVFEDSNNKLLMDYLGQADRGNCFKGQSDAANYHGKVGLHVALGALFGPFAVIGAAVASPNPMKGNETLLMSENSEIFNDPSYLQCYKKKARGKNVMYSAVGWAAWILLFLAAGA